MQRQININTNQQKLTAGEILTILRVLDEQAKKAEQDASPVAETSHYVDIMMGMYIGCTALSIIALPLVVPATLLYWILNVAWNEIDLLAGMDSFKALASEDQKIREAAKINLGSISIMAAATAWSATEVALNGWKIPTAMTAGSTATLVGSAVFSGGLSFAVAMFAGAYQSHTVMKQAEKRSTYEGMKAEVSEISKEKEALKTKITKLQPSSLSIEKITQEISALRKIGAMQPNFDPDKPTTQDFVSNAQKITIQDVLTVDLLLAEQRNIVVAKRLDKTAYILAGVGAALCTCALFLPPLAIPGLLLCAAAAVIKSYQYIEKHHNVGIEGTVNQTSRNEREQVFLATEKKLENEEKDKPRKTKPEEKLLNSYCNRRGLKAADFTNADDLRKAIDLQCKYQYAEENKTWKGFLKHQWKRGEIAKSRFFAAKSSSATSFDNAVPMGSLLALSKFG